MVYVSLVDGASDGTAGAVRGRGTRFVRSIERLPGAAPLQQNPAIERRAIEVVDNAPHGAGEAMQLRTSGLERLPGPTRSSSELGTRPWPDGGSTDSRGSGREVKMSLLDKAKAAAAKVAEGAQKGAQQVQEKVEHTQTRKRADDLAKELGYLIVRERSGGQPTGSAAEDLVSQIVALEAQLEASPPEASSTAPTDVAPASPPAAASESTAGDSALD
jgi:hypothetical protein